MQRPGVWLRITMNFCTILVIIVMLFLSPALATENLRSRLKVVSSILLSAKQINGRHEIGFREIRNSELLVRPAMFEGRLIYDPKSRSIEKAVTDPEVVTMTMNGQALVIETNEGKRHFTLRTRPALRAIMSGFRALLEGDVDALEANFKSHYEQQGDAWRLVLTPRAKRLAKRLASLTVTGQNSRIDSIATLMKNGDHQYMTLIPILAGDE